jgi:hypothetical protein
MRAIRTKFQPDAGKASTTHALCFTAHIARGAEWSTFAGRGPSVTMASASCPSDVPVMRPSESSPAAASCFCSGSSCAPTTPLKRRAAGSGGRARETSVRMYQQSREALWEHVARQDCAACVCHAHQAGAWRASGHCSKQHQQRRSPRSISGVGGVGLLPCLPPLETRPGPTQDPAYSPLHHLQPHAPPCLSRSTCLAPCSSGGGPSGGRGWGWRFGVGGGPWTEGGPSGFALGGRRLYSPSSPAPLPCLASALPLRAPSPT